MHRSALLRPSRLIAQRAIIRPISVSATLRYPGPPANQPPTRAGTEGYESSNISEKPNQDGQSSASQEEHKSGDDHPAKQPDPQSEPERSTGFGGQTEVKGGKEGESARTDKQ